MAKQIDQHLEEPDLFGFRMNDEEIKVEFD
jgi:hypothetical protein